MRAIAAIFILPLAVATHYEDPKNGCGSDEQAVRIQGVKGDFCSPKCKGTTCPTDPPSASDAKPQCALKTTTGDKYCALLCTPGSNAACPTGATCQAIQGVGICTYPAASQATAPTTLTLGGVEEELSNWASHGELMDETELAKPALSDEMIAQLNAANGMTWTAGRNTLFEGATLKDAKVLMGTLQNKNEKTFLPYKAPEQVGDMPADFDWRTDPRAANCPSLKEIRDQANCGSCWAFGSVEAMTDRRCIASKGKDTTHLSAEDVTSCDKLGDMGCSGGIPSTVYTYYRTSGIVDGGNYGDKSGCYSYQLKPCAHHSTSTKYGNCTGETKTPACARKCVDNGKEWVSSKVHGLAGSSVCQQGSSCPDAMMQEIYKNGPITGMFFVHQSFLAYKSGVYKAGMFFKDPMLGGHAIKIMGWGTENGSPYWLVANSWNEDWGDHGFFKIDRGHNQCQIENAMINGGPVAGMPKLSEDLFVV